MFTLKRTVYVLLGSALFYGGCSSKSEEAVAPTISNEALTSISLNLTNRADVSDKATCKYVYHLNNNGEITSTDSTSLKLKPNAVYDMQIVMLDTTQTPVFNVSNEVKERSNYHLFFFQPSPVSAANLAFGTTSASIPGTDASATGPYLNLTVVRADKDTNSPALQVGLQNVFTTGAASSGKLKVILRHQPNAKNGTFAPGSTDLEANFPVTIQ
ncbi:hypothetical protein ABIB40_000153 [Pedobacter sp. UYP30]|uniref:hypothetical protein n=1 Tax=Pedobacter sp. UYP30 TaxID=1756400 RepID=UPI00339768CD